MTTIRSFTFTFYRDGDTRGNLLDNLLSRMEQYACNLEGLVQERTADYLAEKKRAEDLLYLMLPELVSSALLIYLLRLVPRCRREL